MIQTFPNNNALFQDDNAPTYPPGTLQSWFDEHEGKLQHLPWVEQLPDLNIVELLWSVFETRVRNRFPPATSLKQLEDVEEEWYKIPLETVQNLYESIPRRIGALLKVKVGPTQY
jgi:predicted Zn-dependent protease